MELEKAAPAALPKGKGRLKQLVISREICNWQRFNNRRQISSYTGLCPGEYSSGSKRVARSVTKYGNSRKLLVWKIHWFDSRNFFVRVSSLLPGKLRVPEVSGRVPQWKVGYRSVIR